MSKKRRGSARPVRQTPPMATLAPVPAPVLAAGADLLDALDRLRVARREVESSVAVAVASARSAGRSWTEIGARLGVSAQAVQQRYGSSVGRG